MWKSIFRVFTIGEVCQRKIFICFLLLFKRHKSIEHFIVETCLCGECGECFSSQEECDAHVKSHKPFEQLPGDSNNVEKNRASTMENLLGLFSSNSQSEEISLRGTSPLQNRLYQSDGGIIRPFASSASMSEEKESENENENENEIVKVKKMKPMKLCPTCGISVRSNHFSAHARTHSSLSDSFGLALKFKCNFPGCDRTYSSVSNLRKHIRVSEHFDGNDYNSRPEQSPTPNLSQLFQYCNVIITLIYMSFVNHSCENSGCPMTTKYKFAIVRHQKSCKFGIARSVSCGAALGEQDSLETQEKYVLSSYGCLCLSLILNLTFLLHKKQREI